MDNKDPEFVKYLESCRKNGVQITERLIKLWGARKVPEPPQGIKHKFNSELSSRIDEVKVYRGQK